MPRVASRFLVLVMATMLATGWLSARPSPVSAAAGSANIVISQVYGGGGNTGATYTHDFVELFNRGTASQSFAGWSIQYASATGTGNFGANSGQQTDLPAVSLAPGQYLLVQEATNAAVGSPLPTPDATDATPISMAAGAGKVALVRSTTSLGCNGSSGQPCSASALANIVDLVGYGSANFFEGTAAAPTLSATLADFRASGGCIDSDDNAADFGAATPGPRTTSSAFNLCPLQLSINDVSQDEADSGSVGFQFTVSLSAPAGPGGVTFDVDTADGTATTADSDYFPTNLDGETIAEGETTDTFSVAVTGDTTFEPDETFFVNITDVVGATVSDAQGQGTIVNDDPQPNTCGDPFTPIYEIQGSGSAAAITGTVTTEGVVVGDFEGTAANAGFFLQDAAGDGDAATSDGIFVFTGSSDLVTAGEVVRVTGFARERFNQTAINGSNSNTAAVTDVVDCGTGAVDPTDVTLPWASATAPEPYEGMLVRFPEQLVIAEYFNYDRFGEIVLAKPLDGETRPFTGTAVDEPGAAATARAAANVLSRITLDDNQSAQNPRVLRHPNGQPFSLTNRFRGGDHVTNAIGVLGFDFSLYRIFPTAGADYEAANPRTTAPEPVGGTLRVAAMNTLNFFLTLDTTSSDSGPGPCGGGANLDCRGADADQPLEFDRQRTKLLQALAGLDADVLGLNELENTPDVDPLGDPERGIVSGLNALPQFGPGTYSWIDTGVIGTDAIRVGLIYKPGVVTPVGTFQTLDSNDDDRFLDTKNRPALAQTFQVNATGARFTVVVNHLKSKGSACDDVGDPDGFDGQGNCAGVREAAAQALVDWIATDPTGARDPDFLIMGDLNSYAKEDSITAIKAGADDLAGTGDDWTNLIEEKIGTYGYSYVFDGQAGYLDHALANATIHDQVTGVAEWHINADEPDILDYDTSFKPAEQEALYEPNQYRTSDHDPVLVGLDLVNDAPTIAVTAGTSCSASGGMFVLAVDDTEVAPADLSVSVSGNTNPALVTDAVLGGSGANRTLSITTTPKLPGTATITIDVNDGFTTVSTTIEVQSGTDASETLSGTAGADLILGGQGDDSLAGLAGADVLCGGQGADTLAGGAEADALDGGQGDDVLSGGDGNDQLAGQQGSDALAGDDGDDTLTGGSGADSFSGGAGTDTSTDVTPSQGDTTDGT